MNGLSDNIILARFPGLFLLIIIVVLFASSSKAQGQEEAPVLTPLLIGFNYDDAAAYLKQLGLTPRRLSAGQDCQHPQQLNRVVAQMPEAGTPLKPGGHVGLYACPPTYHNPWRQVPDLNGFTLIQARNLMQKLDLRLRVAYKPDCYDFFLHGKIIAQDPAPRTLVKNGDLVKAFICGPRP